MAKKENGEIDFLFSKDSPNVEKIQLIKNLNPKNHIPMELRLGQLVLGSYPGRFANRAKELI